MRELDPLITEFQHEKSRPREAEALVTLRKVASLVKPIMRQRIWRVGTLSEFYPRTANLLGLNVNQGQKICLRLRQPYDERQFIPIEQVVDTMLHELCHIVHGPHNKEFHSLWNQLRDEHEQLICKGYTGEGFLSQGKRLGGRRIPAEEARRVARVAAEKRRVLSAGSGQKLGGARASPGTNMRKIIADATERRIRVTEGCASGTSEGEKLAEEATRNGFKTEAEMDDANERAIMEAYIDLIQQEERELYGTSYTPPSAANPAGPRAVSPPPAPVASKLPPPPPRPASSLSDATAAEPTSNSNNTDSNTWTCSTCTLDNPAMFLACDACASERPQPSNLSQAPKPNNIKTTSKRPFSQSNSSFTNHNPKSRKTAIESLVEIEKNAQKAPLGWVCHGCGTFMESKWWTCAACGTVKQKG